MRPWLRVLRPNLRRPDGTMYLVRRHQHGHAADTREHPRAGRPSPDRHSSLPPTAFSIRTAQYLYSGIFAVGSSASIVSRLAAASTKWNGTNTEPGDTFPVTRAGTTMLPRRERTRTASPSPSPR